MRRLILVICMGILGIVIPASCLACEPPVQNMPAMIEEVVPGHSTQVADSVVPLAQPEPGKEAAEAAPESTKSDKIESSKDEESVGKKAKKGIAALRIMGRVGSGLLKNFMEDLLGDA
ncbi:hypothetical protein H8E52_05040 [bacterium]|nr:hypothetical protein [bacterium]